MNAVAHFRTAEGKAFDPGGQMNADSADQDAHGATDEIADG